MNYTSFWDIFTVCEISLYISLARQDASTTIRELKSVFYERFSPVEIITDNAPAFSGQSFLAFVAKWSLWMRYRCVNVSESNGIAKQCHRIVEKITAGMRCSIQEAVSWYSVMPYDDETPSRAPAKVYTRMNSTWNVIYSSTCSCSITTTQI